MKGFMQEKPDFSVSLSHKKQFERCGDRLVVRAPGKINLSLLIAGKREDGFHEIDTIMAKIALYDKLIFESGRSDGVELVCQGDYWAPEGRDNLVFRAVEAAFEAAGTTASVKVTLCKNMPAGSGLGSASSDAATALLGINRFCDLGLSREVLVRLAAKLGSDVVFFLDGPLARCRGRGEIVEKIIQNFDFSVVLLLPNVSVSTKMVYESYRHDVSIYEKLYGEINGYIEKSRFDLVGVVCANMLQKSCFQIYGELSQLKKRIENIGLNPLALSGSGSAMYYLLRGCDKGRIEQLASEVKAKTGCNSVIVNNNRW